MPWHQDSPYNAFDRSGRPLPACTGKHRSLVGEQYPIALSPLVAFGAPTLTGTGIKTRVVVARIDAGESSHQVAEDYGVDPAYVKIAILFENAA